MNEIGEFIERGLIAIDDGKESTALFRDHRERCRRLDLEGRSENHEYFARLAPFPGPSHRLCGQFLPERNICRFEETTAAVASWGSEIFRQVFVHGGRLKALTASEARHKPVRPVELNQLLVGNTRDPMKPVDVLRDHAEKLPACLKIANGEMSTVRPGGLVQFVGFFFELPVADPRRFARHELVEVYRLVPRP